MFHNKYFRVVPIAAVLVIAGSLSNSALAKNKNTVMVDEPLCYAVLKGKFMNLNKLCGVQEVLPMINLKIDNNRDGVPDQLLAALKTQQKAIANARSIQEVYAAEQAFEQRLPYSSQVRQMQAQRRNLREISRREENIMKSMEIMERSSQIQAQIEDDPNYRTIQAAIDKANRILGVGRRSASIYTF